MSDTLNRRDLDIILEVNKRSIEIETEVANQNEEIIELLKDNIDQGKGIEKKLDEYIKEADKINDQFFITDKTILDVNHELNNKSKEIENKINQFSNFQEELKENNKDITEIIKKIENKFDASVSNLDSKIEEINKNIFQLKVLLTSGLVSLVVQIIQMFIKK